MITDKHGGRHEPTAAGGTIVFVLVIAFGIVWTLIAGAMFPPFALFGIVFIGAAVFGMLSTQKKAQAYKRAHQAYKLRRHRLSAADFFPNSSQDHPDGPAAGATNPPQAARR